MKRAVLMTARLLSIARLFPNRLMLLIIGPQKLIEYDEIVRMADLNLNDTVLDIGCGEGEQTLLLGQKCRRITGIDISDQGIETANDLARVSGLSGRVSFVRGNILDADFPNGSFSKIVSICVLEHIPEWREVLKKVHGWLTPQGVLIISVDSLTQVKYGAVVENRWDFINFFDTPSLASALRDAGFLCSDIHPILRSAYAKRNFVEGDPPKSFGGWNILRLIGVYHRLREAENNPDNEDEGIFLVAKAQP